MSWCVKYENGDQTDLQEQNNCMICIAFTCSLDLYNILDLIVNQTFSITNESFLKVKKHVVPPGCYGCNTITRSRLKLFWSLAINSPCFIRLGIPITFWLIKIIVFLLKILSRKSSFFKKSDRVT